MKNKVLNKFVGKTILSFHLCSVDADNVENQYTEQGRNSERLTILFSDSTELVISTVCSGSREDSCFSMSSYE